MRTLTHRGRHMTYEIIQMAIQEHIHSKAHLIVHSPREQQKAILGTILVLVLSPVDVLTVSLSVSKFH